MKKIIILLVLLMTSCSDGDDVCNCEVKISGYYMDYNIKPYTGVIVQWVGTEETNITNCDRDGEVLFNNHGRIGTLSCK